MPWKLVQTTKQLAKRAKNKVEEEVYLKQVDDFLLAWMNSLPPEQLRAAILARSDPTQVLLDEDFKADVWRRTPWMADHAIYRYATQDRIRSYVVNRLPKLAPEHWKVVQQTNGVEFLVKSARAVIKELFD